VSTAERRDSPRAASLRPRRARHAVTRALSDRCSTALAGRWGGARHT
jgi:hypothetical protein